MSDVPLRPQKKYVVDLIVNSAPDLLEQFRGIQEREGWQKFSARMAEYRKRFVVDNYVVLYQKEASIGLCLLHCYQSVDEIKSLSDRLEVEGVEAQQVYLDGVASEVLLAGDADFETIFSHVFESDEEHKKSFEKLSLEDQAKLIKQAQYFLGFFLSWFHNIIAVMVLGEKLTSLVPKAMAGDDDAFCKAIHIDKNLLHNHPYFHTRYETAQSNRENEFLKRIGRNKRWLRFVGQHFPFLKWKPCG